MRAIANVAPTQRLCHNAQRVPIDIDLRGGEDKEREEPVRCLRCLAKSIVWTITYTLYAADKEGLVLQIQRQVVHMIDAAHKEILWQRQMPEAVRGNGHDLLVLIDLQAEGR